jgi:hypothetical protein
LEKLFFQILDQSVSKSNHIIDRLWKLKLGQETLSLLARTHQTFCIQEAGDQNNEKKTKNNHCYSNGSIFMTEQSCTERVGK